MANTNDSNEQLDYFTEEDKKRHKLLYVAFEPKEVYA